MARALHVSRTGPGGVLIIGGSSVTREIAMALSRRGVRSVIWTTDPDQQKAAADEGLTTYTGDPTTVSSTRPPPELDDVDFALLMSDDDGLNGMLAADLGEYFEHDRVYQLAPSAGDDIDFYVRSRVLFDDSATHAELESRHQRGAVVDAVKVDPERDAKAGEGAIAMFVLAPDHLRILAAGDVPNPGPGDELIGLVTPPR